MSLNAWVAGYHWSGTLNVLRSFIENSLIIRGVHESGCVICILLFNGFYLAALSLSCFMNERSMKDGWIEWALDLIIYVSHIKCVDCWTVIYLCNLTFMSMNNAFQMYLKYRFTYVFSWNYEELVLDKIRQVMLCLNNPIFTRNVTSKQGHKTYLFVTAFLYKSVVHVNIRTFILFPIRLNRHVPYLSAVWYSTVPACRFSLRACSHLVYTQRKSAAYCGSSNLWWNFNVKDIAVYMLQIHIKICNCGFSAARKFAAFLSHVAWKVHKPSLPPNMSIKVE